MLVAVRTADGYRLRAAMIKSMLVATDGSETAGKAVSEAAEIAAAAGARVHVMTAYQPLRAKVASRGTVLVVVGNKGLRGARRFLLGSVPGKVSHHAPCSVLIVHTT